MTIQEALSQARYAERDNSKGQKVTAIRHTAYGVTDYRICKGVTDQTVVRKLNKTELAATDWQPIDTSIYDKWCRGER